MINCYSSADKKIMAEAISDSCIRLCVADTDDKECGLNRYSIYETLPSPDFSSQKNGENTVISVKNARLEVSPDGDFIFSDGDGRVLLSSKSVEKHRAGFDASLAYNEGARIYGLGDATRRQIEKTGFATEMWVRNVKCYIPISFIHSHDGWGLLLNSTWRHAVDVGHKEKDTLRIAAKGGAFDVYLFAAPSTEKMLYEYTRVVGRPIMLPKWAYGLSFVANQNNDINDTMNDCKNFRREDIPCDIIGLEPGWTADHRYHFGTDKQWNGRTYPVPAWQKGDKASTFLGAMERINFHLSLWLCIEYDLSYEEERRAGYEVKPDEIIWDDDDYVHDSHFATKARLDENTKLEEPFFEHLKKFVDDGAECFKLDGCHQIDDHPDRQWGNGMSDEEMHNLFPLIYAKQMSLGFREHTGRRAMIYTSGGYTGIQKYAATWAGDTGGGAKPLASMLNLGYSGHSNVSCDMETNSAEGIHFGFMQTWSQLSNWAYWNQPWYLGDDLCDCFRFYAKLRYRLAPYIYTMAHKAAETGYPVMRAMSMEYPEMKNADALCCQYMFGDSILTSAFVDEVALPEGGWINGWTGENADGGKTYPVIKEGLIGGPLYIKAGAIIPTMADKNHLGTDAFENVIFNVYPSPVETSFTLYDDDGITYGYETGSFAEVTVTARRDGGKTTVTVMPRKGGFDGMPEKCVYTVALCSGKASSATVDGTPAELAESKSFCGTDAVSVRIEVGEKPVTIEFRS